MPSNADSLTEQRRALPDSPGVYLFKDASGRALYVGKAKSIRKRVASHFSGQRTRMAEEFLERVESIDFVGDRQRGGGAAGRAELHQAVPAAVQHPAARRQVLSVHRDLAGRALSRASTSRASATGPTGPTSALSRAPSGCARRSTCWAGSSRTAPARAASRAAHPAAPASTTSSSAARRPASATSARRTTARTSTRSSTSSPAATAQIERELEQRHGGGRRRAGVRAGGRLPQPPAGGALAVRAPAGGATRPSARWT